MRALSGFAAGRSVHDARPHFTPRPRFSLGSPRRRAAQHWRRPSQRGLIARRAIMKPRLTDPPFPSMREQTKLTDCFDNRENGPSEFQTSPFLRWRRVAIHTTVSTYRVTSLKTSWEINRAWKRETRAPSKEKKKKNQTISVFKMV